MLASLNGHTATVELLLGAGADKEAKNKVRET
jgi:ankyrin repeat protein